MGSKRLAGIVLFGKQSSGRGRGIEYRLGEDTLALGQRGNYAESGDAGAQPRALPIHKEERRVFLDGSAESRAILIPPEFRIRSGLREQVARIERLVAEELKQASVELIASGFSDHHYSAAVGTAILGRVRVDVEFEFGHAVYDRVVDHLPRLRLQHADAVVDILVGARAAAVDSRQELAVGKRHARR